VPDPRPDRERSSGDSSGHGFGVEASKVTSRAATSNHDGEIGLEIGETLKCRSYPSRRFAPLNQRGLELKLERDARSLQLAYEVVVCLSPRARDDADPQRHDRNRVCRVRTQQPLGLEHQQETTPRRCYAAKKSLDIEGRERELQLRRTFPDADLAADSNDATYLQVDSRGVERLRDPRPVSGPADNLKLL
jgi:hypothetical protein